MSTGGGGRGETTDEGFFGVSSEENMAEISTDLIAMAATVR